MDAVIGSSDGAREITADRDGRERLRDAGHGGDLASVVVPKAADEPRDALRAGVVAAAAGRDDPAADAADDSRDGCAERIERRGEAAGHWGRPQLEVIAVPPTHDALCDEQRAAVIRARRYRDCRRDPGHGNGLSTLPRHNASIRLASIQLAVAVQSPAM